MTQHLSAAALSALDEWEPFGLPKRSREMAEACADSLNKWSPMARYEFRVFPVGGRYAIKRRYRA